MRLQDLAEHEGLADKVSISNDFVPSNQFRGLYYRYNSAQGENHTYLRFLTSEGQRIYYDLSESIAHRIYRKCHSEDEAESEKDLRLEALNALAKIRGFTFELSRPEVH